MPKRLWYLCVRATGGQPRRHGPRKDATTDMSMLVIVAVVAVVLVLLLVGAGVLVFVMKSKSGKKAQPASASPSPQFPAPAQSFNAPDNPWPQQQQESAPPPAWGAPPPADAAQAAEPFVDPFPAPAPPLDPFPAPAMPGNSDPYATTPSVDASELPPNPDLFMTTPSSPRATSMDMAPAHLKADDGSVIHLNRQAMRVGRHPECDVVIPTPGTSRQHAEFEFRDGAWFVTDLNSGNGTYVNNTRVRSQQLSTGDEIRIDQTRFTFGAGS